MSTTETTTPAERGRADAAEARALELEKAADWAAYLSGASVPARPACDAEMARLRAVAAGGAREVQRAIAEAVSAERDRADAAEAKLAEIHAYCRDECEVVNEGVRLVAIVRASDILAIIGSEEGSDVR